MCCQNLTPLSVENCLFNTNKFDRPVLPITSISTARKNKFSDLKNLPFGSAIFGPRTLFRTNGSSDQWDFFGPMSRRTNDTLFRTNGFRTNDTFSDQWVVGPTGFWTNGPSDQWVFGLMGRRTNGLSDHRHCTGERKILVIITQCLLLLTRTHHSYTTHAVPSRGVGVGGRGGGGVEREISRSYAVSAPADQDASQLYYSYHIIRGGGMLGKG